MICSVSYASVGDVDRAVAAAKEAYDNGPWGKMNPRDRGSLLYRYVAAQRRTGKKAPHELIVWGI